jgi:hypothetical protein
VAARPGEDKHDPEFRSRRDRKVDPPIYRHVSRRSPAHFSKRSHDRRSRRMGEVNPPIRQTICTSCRSASSRSSARATKHTRTNANEPRRMSCLYPRGKSPTPHDAAFSETARDTKPRRSAARQRAVSKPWRAVLSSVEQFHCTESAPSGVDGKARAHRMRRSY